jgi:hypothetical protein
MTEKINEIKYTRNNLIKILSKLNNCNEEVIGFSKFPLTLHVQLTSEALFANDVKKSEDTEIVRKALLNVMTNSTFNFDDE